MCRIKKEMMLKMLLRLLPGLNIYNEAGPIFSWLENGPKNITVFTISFLGFNKTVLVGTPCVFEVDLPPETKDLCLNFALKDSRAFHALLSIADLKKAINTMSIPVFSENQVVVGAFNFKYLLISLPSIPAMPIFTWNASKEVSASYASWMHVSS